jgi:hypothetical protein
VEEVPGTAVCLTSELEKILSEASVIFFAMVTGDRVKY